MSAEVKFNGLSWRDMPGNGVDDRKITFALYKRGLYKLTPANADDAPPPDLGADDEDDDTGEESPVSRPPEEKRKWTSREWQAHVAEMDRQKPEAPLHRETGLDDSAHAKFRQGVREALERMRLAPTAASEATGMARGSLSARLAKGSTPTSRKFWRQKINRLEAKGESFWAQYRGPGKGHKASQNNNTSDMTHTEENDENDESDQREIKARKVRAMTEAHERALGEIREMLAVTGTSVRDLCKRLGLKSSTLFSPSTFGCVADLPGILRRVRAALATEKEPTATELADDQAELMGKPTDSREQYDQPPEIASIPWLKSKLAEPDTGEQDADPVSIDGADDGDEGPGLPELEEIASLAKTIRTNTIIINQCRARIRELAMQI